MASPTSAAAATSAFITTDASGVPTTVTITSVATATGYPPKTIEVPVPFQTSAGTHTAGPNSAVTIAVSTVVPLIGISLIFALIAWIWKSPWARRHQAQRGWGGGKYQNTEPTPMTSTTPSHVENGKSGYAFSPDISPQSSRFASNVQQRPYAEGQDAR